VLNVEGLFFLGNNHVNKSVCKQDNVEVSNVGFEFVVETNWAKRIVDFFTGSDRLFGKDDLLNFLVDWQQYFNVWEVKLFEVI